MIRLFSRAQRLAAPLTRAVPAFRNSDWQKDREKAAEKEYAIREEKQKMERLRAKVSEERHEVKLKNPLDNVDDSEQVWKDREYLQVG